MLIIDNLLSEKNLKKWFFQWIFYNNQYSYVQNVEELILFHNIMNLNVYEWWLSYFFNVKGGQLKMTKKMILRKSDNLLMTSF